MLVSFLLKKKEAQSATNNTQGIYIIVVKNIANLAPIGNLNYINYY